MPRPKADQPPPLSDPAWAAAFDEIRTAAAALDLPGVEEGTWFGTPALKVAGKGFLRLRAPDILVLLCPHEEKEMLLAAAPEIYFETDHYKGWPALLARLPKLTPDELRHRIERAWRHKAPKTLVRERDGAPSGPFKAKRRS